MTAEARQNIYEIGEIMTQFFMNFHEYSWKFTLVNFLWNFMNFCELSYVSF